MIEKIMEDDFGYPVIEIPQEIMDKLGLKLYDNLNIKILGDCIVLSKINE